LKVVAVVNPLSRLVDGLRGLMVSPTFSSLPSDAFFLSVASLLVLIVAAVEYPRLLS
jgi:hypothetical protein